MSIFTPSQTKCPAKTSPTFSLEASLTIRHVHPRLHTLRVPSATLLHHQVIQAVYYLPCLKRHSTVSKSRILRSWKATAGTKSLNSKITWSSTVTSSTCLLTSLPTLLPSKETKSIVSSVTSSITKPAQVKTLPVSSSTVKSPRMLLAV